MQNKEPDTGYNRKPQASPFWDTYVKLTAWGNRADQMRTAGSVWEARFQKEGKGREDLHMLISAPKDAIRIHQKGWSEWAQGQDRIITDWGLLTQKQEAECDFLLRERD